MADDMSMRKIAELAGVSPATVSRVFNSSQLVSQKTRDKVMRAVKESGYIFNLAASDFSSKKSTVIGVLVPTADSLFGATLSAIQEKALSLGYSIMQGVTQYDLEIEQKILRQYQERRVAGIIMTGLVAGQEDFLERLAESGMPIVVTWERLETPRISCVGFDNKAGAKAAVQHLIDLGHRRIGGLFGPYTRISRANKRLAGYLEALKENGLEPDDGLILERRPRLVEGAEAMSCLLSRDNPPTAVFAASDALAIGAMRAAQDRGLVVPDDVSIIGFDDFDVAAYLNPPLTTMRVDAQKIGALAAETVIGMARGEIVEPRQYILGTDLIVRKSCAMFRKTAG